MKVVRKAQEGGEEMLKCGLEIEDTISFERLQAPPLAGTRIYWSPFPPGGSSDDVRSRHLFIPKSAIVPESFNTAYPTPPDPHKVEETDHKHVPVLCVRISVHCV